MVCEFLSRDYKRKLLEIATVNELMESGFQTKAGAYKAKEVGVISDDKCEKLVQVLGEKARPILLQALIEFVSQLGCQVDCEKPEKREEPEEAEKPEEPEEAEEPEKREEPEEREEEEF
jgi:hypothetical protein